MERPQANNPTAVGVRDFKCKICGRQFPTFQALGGHTAGHTNRSGESSNTRKTHRCSICSESFNSGQALGGHMSKHRRPLQPASSSTSDNADVANPDEGLMLKKIRPSLDFDLNSSPALEEEDCCLSLSTSDQDLQLNHPHCEDLTPNLDQDLQLNHPHCEDLTPNLDLALRL